jgi:hypothetical protein
MRGFWELTTETAFDCAVGGPLAGLDHAGYSRWPGQISRNRYVRLDEKVCLRNCNCEVSGISSLAARVAVVKSDSAKQRTKFPYVGANHEIGAQIAAGIGGQHARDSAILQEQVVAYDRAANHSHCATGTYGRCKSALSDRYGLLRRYLSSNRCEREVQIVEGLGQVARAKALQLFAI